MGWQTRLQHLRLALAQLPGLLTIPQHRHLLREMGHFCRLLPPLFELPLPAALEAVESASIQNRPLPSVDQVRALADLAALLDRRSPLGICLRRSLVRYKYLRAAELPVVIKFGAKLGGKAVARSLHGHAWLQLEKHPYHEANENWQGFTVIYSWPPDG